VSFFAKFSRKKAFFRISKIRAQNRVRENFFWKMAKNRQKSTVFWLSDDFENHENRQSVRQSSRNRLGPTVKVPQNFALSSKNTLTGPNSFSSPSYGQNENFWAKKKNFFFGKIFFRPKSSKKMSFQKRYFRAIWSSFGRVRAILSFWPLFGPVLD
jgi:hypothetical protein